MTDIIRKKRHVGKKTGSLLGSSATYLPVLICKNVALEYLIDFSIDYVGYENIKYCISCRTVFFCCFNRFETVEKHKFA